MFRSFGRSRLQCAWVLRKMENWQDLLQWLRGGGVNKLTMFFLRVFVQKGKKGKLCIVTSRNKTIDVDHQ